jgi:hypothetical protein
MHVPGRPAGSPHKVAYRERDIHQRRVSGDGEGGGSGDEEEKGVIGIGMNKKKNSKIELVDFNGMLQRLKMIKLRKSGVCKKRKPRSKNV